MTIRLKYFYLILVIIVALQSLAQAQGKKLYMTGLHRGYFNNSHINGPAFDGDSLSSLHKVTGFYFLDMGMNFEGEDFKGVALLRAKNLFGAFFGAGASMGFRQFTIEGNIKRVIKFQIGDLDLGMTKYTLFNPEEIYHDYESDLFAIRREIVHYENFNLDNKWRLQGFNTSTAFKMKNIDRLSFDLFATKTRSSRYVNSNNMFVQNSFPDRILTGGRVGMVQSKYLQLGGNFVSIFDVEGTQLDTPYTFNNKVLTGDYKINIPVGNFMLSTFGEAGSSYYKHKIKVQSDTATTYNDFFYDLGLSVEHTPSKIKLFASYRNVGPQFTSPGAQTLRVRMLDNPFYLGSIGNETGYRFPTLFERLSDESIYNQRISAGLMNFHPVYNNSTPYGLATPNRKGLTVGLSAKSSVVTADAAAELLQEINPEGTLESRKFTVLRGGLRLKVNELVKLSRLVEITAGLRYEETERGGIAAPVNLKTALLDAGIAVEVLKNFDLLVGYKSLRGRGTEMLNIRDNFNRIVNVAGPFNFDCDQQLISAGIRYRISPTAYFSMHWNTMKFKSQESAGYSTLIANNLEYKFNQIMFTYTLSF